MITKQETIGEFDPCSYLVPKEMVVKITNPRLEYKTRKTRYWPTVEVRTTPKIGRNQPCPCGSGKKNKKCCKQ